MEDPGAVNLRWADAFVAGLQRGGVIAAVLSPGSRSTPLALALARSSLELQVAPDERVGGFLALGIARASGRPVALAATSGSAPGHWYPAVLEAHEDHVPLVLLSADRPPELWDVGANQTTNQQHLFGDRVRAFVPAPAPGEEPGAVRHAAHLGLRASEQARWPRPGPVHVNLPFREPLLPAGEIPAPPAAGGGGEVRWPELQPSPETIAEAAAALNGRPGLIVAGRLPPDTAPAVAGLAAALDAPVLADPLSGLRFGAHDRSRVVTAYDAWLRDPALVDGLRPDWVLALGGTPVSKALGRFLERCPARRLVAAPWGAWPDPAHGAWRALRVAPGALCAALAAAGVEPAAPAWRERVLALEAHGQAAAAHAMPVEGQVLRTACDMLPSGSRVFCGGSMAIRDVDTFVSGGPTALQLYGNRGVSGIDGHVATAAGIAAGARAPVLAVLGDLALYHDMNGLLHLRGRHVVLVVFNNGGGGIFEYLPQARLPELERLWLTPTGLDLSRVADLYGLGFCRVGPSAEGFAPALAAALEAPGPWLVEVVVDRADSVARHRDYWRRARPL